MKNFLSLLLILFLLVADAVVLALLIYIGVRYY